MQSDVTAWRARYLEAQLQGQRRAALAVVDEALAAGLSVRQLQLEVVQEAQRAIGALWEQNRISVAQEHVATAISQIALARLFDRATRVAAPGKRVVVACVAGELHDFPARIAADVLDLAGFDVCFAGANVPTDHLLSLLSDEQPAALCLSVTMSHHLDELRAAVAAVRARFPTLPVLVGGHACRWSPGVVADVGADGSADDAAGLVEAVDRLTRARS